MASFDTPDCGYEHSQPAPLYQSLSHTITIPRKIKFSPQVLKFVQVVHHGAGPPLNCQQIKFTKLKKIGTKKWLKKDPNQASGWRFIRTSEVPSLATWLSSNIRLKALPIEACVCLVRVGAYTYSSLHAQTLRESLLTFDWRSIFEAQLGSTASRTPFEMPGSGCL